MFCPILLSFLLLSHKENICTTLNAPFRKAWLILSIFKWSWLYILQHTLHVDGNSMRIGLHRHQYAAGWLSTLLRSLYTRFSNPGCWTGTAGWSKGSSQMCWMGLRSGLCKDQTIYVTPNLEIPLLIVHLGGHCRVETAKELTETES